MSRKAVACLTATMVLTLSGTELVVAGPSQPAVASSSMLRWHACSFPVGKPPPDRADSTVTCSTVRVPLDYRNPRGRSIVVAISRFSLGSPAGRHATLMIDEGGPSAGLEDAMAFGYQAPLQIVRRYDVVSFDPRGFGQSDPVTCGLTLAEQARYIPWPLPGGIAANARVARRIAAQCARHARAQMPYLTTANVARDMDRIRAMLADRTISYYGLSWGSYLGMVYATLYRHHTGRVVLDSVPNPEWIWRDGFRAWGPGAEIRFPDFARFAAGHAARYHLGTTAGEVRRRYFLLAGRLDTHPLPTPEGQLTGNMLRMGTFGALYADSAFPVLARLWRAVQRSNAAAAGTTAGQLGLWPQAADENDVAAKLGFVCDDAAWPRSLATYRHDVRTEARRFPLVGAMAAGIWPCAFWASRPREPKVAIDGRGPANILLVNNRRDPATPYLGALKARATLQRRARLVSVDQGGHGVYLITHNSCANNAITRYLTGGRLPSSDVSCPIGTQLRDLGNGSGPAAKHR